MSITQLQTRTLKTTGKRNFAVIVTKSELSEELTKEFESLNLCSYNDKFNVIPFRGNATRRRGFAVTLEGFDTADALFRAHGKSAKDKIQRV